MAVLPQQVRETIAKVRVAAIATATPDGVPNLVYIGCFRVLDEATIEIADNRFCKTRQNLDANPVLAMTVYNPDDRACFQIKGRVDLVTESTLYADCVQWVKEGHPALTPKAAVILHVQEVYAGAERLA